MHREAPKPSPWQSSAVPSRETHRIRAYVLSTALNEGDSSTCFPKVCLKHRRWRKRRSTVRLLVQLSSTPRCGLPALLSLREMRPTQQAQELHPHRSSFESTKAYFPCIPSAEKLPQWQVWTEHKSNKDQPSTPSTHRYLSFGERGEHLTQMPRGTRV